MNREFIFSEEFGEIDERLVECAGREWEERRYSVFRLYGRKIACVAMAAALGFAIAGNSRVQAAIKEVATMISRMWGISEDLSPYTDVINQSRKKDGFTVTLKEVILSDKQLYTAVTVNSDSGEGYLENAGYVTINGKDYAISETYDQSGDNGNELGAFRPEHVYTMIFEDTIPEEISEMELHYRAYRSDADLLNQEKGIRFDFAFSATRGELEKSKISIPLDIVIPLGNGSDMELSQMTLTALDSRIEARITGEGKHASEYYLEGTDSLGNLVWYYGFVPDEEAFAFECSLQSEALPSLDSEWIELRLFTYQNVNQDEWKAVDEVDGEDIVMEDDEGPINQVYIGDRFKIIQGG